MTATRSASTARVAVMLLACIAACLISTQASADQVDDSIAQLSSVNPYDRRAAMESLGASKDARAVGPLIGRLGDRRDGEHAAKALAAISTPSLNLLLKALASKAPTVRGNAARALGFIGNSKSVKPLLGLLKDPIPELRAMAIQSLGFSKDPAVTAALLKIYNDPAQEYEVQQAACNTIVRIGDPKAINVLLARLDEGGDIGHVELALARLTDIKVVRAVIAAVAKNDSPQMTSRLWSDQGEPIVPPLVTLLKDPVPGVRAGAAWALAGVLERTKDARALEPLTEALKDVDAGVRTAAVRALGELGGDSAVDALAKALDDPDARVRDRTVSALQDMKNPRAVLPLCAKLSDPDKQVRVSVTYALLEFADPRSADALIQATHDLDSSVRHGAYLALSSTRDPRAREILLGALGSSDTSARQAAANGLGRVGGKDAVEPLIAALKDPDAEVKRCAAVSLGSIGDRKAVEPLIELLKGAGKELRSDVADALGSRKDPRAVKPLIEIALGNPEDGVGIMMTLAEMGDTSAVEPIIALLDNKGLDKQTRDSILWVLGKFKDKRATPVLLAAIEKDDFQLTYGIIEALALIRDPRAFDALVELLKAPEGFYRWKAAYALSLLDDPRVDGVLMPYVDKGDLAVIAGADQFFVKRGVEKAIEPLVDVLNAIHPDSTLPEAFIASGRHELVEAGTKWRAEHPVDYLPEPDVPYVKWGEARK